MTLEPGVPLKVGSGAHIVLDAQAEGLGHVRAYAICAGETLVVSLRRGKSVEIDGLLEVQMPRESAAALLVKLGGALWESERTPRESKPRVSDEQVAALVELIRKG